ncbi:MAG: hypothetical protein JXR23_08090 [Pontiellaceae bacterium]|nr:hypothetical protein [Pontiellaceae bacterium]
MNKIIPIALLLCTTAPTFAESTEEIWKNLAVHSQNLAYKFQTMGGYSSDEGSRDIHHYTNELDAVENDLKALVKQNVVNEETLELSEAEINTLWGDDEYQELMETLFDRYGGYTAREMLDIGTRLRLQNTNLPIQVSIRLPENELTQFKKIAESYLLEDPPNNSNAPKE